MSEPSKDDTGGLWGAVKDGISGLKNQPEKLFFALMALIGAGLLLRGIDAMYAVGLPLALCVLYLCVTIVRGIERRGIAEIGLKRLELTKGNDARQRARKALERRKGKAQ